MAIVTLYFTPGLDPEQQGVLIKLLNDFTNRQQRDGGVLDWKAQLAEIKQAAGIASDTSSEQESGDDSAYEYSAKETVLPLSTDSYSTVNSVADSAHENESVQMDDELIRPHRASTI